MGCQEPDTKLLRCLVSPAELFHGNVHVQALPYGICACVSHGSVDPIRPGDRHRHGATEMPGPGCRVIDPLRHHASDVWAAHLGRWRRNHDLQAQCLQLIQRPSWDPAQVRM